MFKLFFLVPLFTVVLTSFVHAKGEDKVYTQSSGKTWGQWLESYFNYRGYNKSYALIIGISTYSSEHYLATEEDPIRMKDYLLNEAGFDYVHVLTQDKVTVRRVRELMSVDFPHRLQEDDRFLFYWSGHGVTRKLPRNGVRGYFPLAKTQRNQYHSMISMENIEQWDKLLKAKQTLYLLDSCFSGLAGETAQGSKTEQTLKQLAKPSRQLLTAGTATESTYVIDAQQSSIFTMAVLRGLKGAADSENGDFKKDGIVSVNELERYVKRYISEKLSSRTVTPQLKELRGFDGNDGDFFFFSSKKQENLVKADEVEPIRTSITAQSSENTLPKKYELRNEKGKWNPKIYRGERSYTKNTQATVKDNYTGLIWQNKDNRKRYNWEDAKKHCSTLSLDGYQWRLPSIEELYYLADASKYNPAIDKAYFDLKSSWYWSSTSYKNYDSSAWVVYFRNGGDGWSYETLTYYVLCVSGQ